MTWTGKAQNVSVPTGRNVLSDRGKSVEGRLRRVSVPTGRNVLSDRLMFCGTSAAIVSVPTGRNVLSDPFTLQVIICQYLIFTKFRTPPEIDVNGSFFGEVLNGCGKFVPVDRFMGAVAG